MDVALAGILPKDGCVDFITSSLLHKNIKIIPLKTTEENYLEAVVYWKKVSIHSMYCSGCTVQVGKWVGGKLIFSTFPLGGKLIFSTPVFPEIDFLIY